MATIDSKQVVFDLIINDGVYEGDPRAYSIHSYVNSWGGVSYGLAYNEIDHNRYRYPSYYVINPQLLWSRDHGVTGAGQSFLDQMSDV